jgi:Uma2 family endonuclease
MENQVVQVEVTQPGADFDLTQIINGEEIVMPSPLSIHQIILGNLFLELSLFVRKTKAGRVCTAPLDVILEEGVNRVQPDILFVRQDRLGIIRNFVEGAPDLIIEIISPSSLDMDTTEKKEIYERFGVPEYWIVEPRLKLIEVFSLEGGKYRLDNYAVESGTVTSRLLPGFAVDLEIIFEA